MADAAPPAPAASAPAPAPASELFRFPRRRPRSPRNQARRPHSGLVKAATASAIKEDSALREAAQTGTLTLKMVRKTVVRRMARRRGDAALKPQGPHENRDAPGRDGGQDDGKPKEEGAESPKPQGFGAAGAGRSRRE